MASPPARARLMDVAAHAGVSTATASLVLRGRPGPSAETREAVLQASQSLGYRPDRTASLLARRRTHLLGLTVEVSNPFHGELLEDLQVAAEKAGYDVVVSPLTRHRGERRAVEALLDSRCEAVLLLGPSLPANALEAIAAVVPVVAVGRRVRAEGVDLVRAADDRGMALAVQHLVGLGHREIAFADGPPGSIATLRRQGYRRAMRDLGCSSGIRVVAGGDTEEGGAAATAALVATPPTAVIAFNDRSALGVLDHLRRSDLQVPADVSVVGYDDSPVARLATIDLTSVSQAPGAMADAAVDVVVDRLESGRTAAVEVVIEPHLVRRGTTAPPRSAPSRP
ncbi:MAG TPA: LacI family DNA-binding transcriptional regulator [Dermatophilaceae bacterium]|nr:LacI family DNA-binding transcriptional regulator [Dermatophilaceae bacterium]